ncbi:MAG TPA: hypothetical protein PK913_12555, partial [Phenylobacterium sp.]|nr:hypothetical protein [Phenylobacterium sp.]
MVVRAFVGGVVAAPLIALSLFSAAAAQQVAPPAPPSLQPPPAEPPPAPPPLPFGVEPGEPGDPGGEGQGRRRGRGLGGRRL